MGKLDINTAVSAASNVGSGIIGMIGQRRREKRAMNNQKQLMELQQRHQQQLNQQGFDLQKRMWDETNYEAQMEHLKNAGLNPALLYGTSGGGGVTTGSQGGGSAAGGHAPAPQEMPIFDIQQSLMMKAQLDLMKAQANKTEAEADSIRGEEGTIGASEIRKNLADVLNTEAQTALRDLELEIGNATKEDQINKATYEVEELIKRNNLTDTQADLAREEILTEAVKRQLMHAQVNLNNEQAKKLVHDIRQGYIQLDNMLAQIQESNMANKLRALEGKTEIEKIKNDFILGAIGKEIDLSKLNVEQQKVFVSLFNSLLGLKPTPQGHQSVGGFGKR